MNQQQLITDALTEIGVQDAVTPLSQADLLLGSRVLKQMIDSWNADRLYINGEQRVVFVPSVLKQTYTLGPGGDFNITPVPAKISRYGVINLGNPIQPLELGLESLTTEEWGAIPVKNIASALPQRVWDDTAFPLRHLNYWPVPNVQVQFTIYSWGPVRDWDDFVTDITFPPGYEEALRLNLALRLAPSFKVVLDPATVELARIALNRVKAMNAPLIDLRCDPMLTNPQGQVYNWLTDNAGERG